jgi:hypothetical protein
MDEFLEQDGRTLEEICQAVLFGEESAPALCDEGCEVEPDGTLSARLPIHPARCGINLNVKTNGVRLPFDVTRKNIPKKMRTLVRVLDLQPWGSVVPP